MKNDKSIAQAREVLTIEAQSILSLIDRIDERFSRAVDIIYHSRGRVIVTGIGKSGLIGKKIVATLTSTGTPALFLHPVEGIHGDLGIVHKDDVLLAISNSGETHELNVLTKSIRDLGMRIIAFTGNPHSTLANASDVAIDVGVAREACPFGLTPTSSSTASLAMGDALAIALVNKRKFTEKDFYKFHPGGSLGQRLMAKVRDVMISDDRVPWIYTGTPALQAVEVIDDKNVGFVIIVDRRRRLLGILTDGDVRRIVRKRIPLNEKSADQIMTKSPKTIAPGTSVAETLEVLQKNEITALVVVDGKGRLEGYVHLHDILGRGGTIQMTMMK